MTDLAVMEVFGDHICPNTLVVYYVVAMSVISTERSDSIAFVVIVALF